MPKLPRGIQRQRVLKAFRRAGWEIRPTKRGTKHTVMVKEGVEGILSIPRHSTIKVGTLDRLLETAGLTVEEFLRLLK